MADELPWFPFYVDKFCTDNRVLSLTNEQRGIYLWLMCRQWKDGSLPLDPVHVYPLMPNGSDSVALGYVLTMFFPPDPDTNERRNPALHDIREERWAAYLKKTKGLAKARESRWVEQITEQDTEQSSVGAESPSSSVSVKEGIPKKVFEALSPFLDNPKTRTARIGQVRGLLQGMTDKPVSPEAMARGLTDFLANGGNWSAIGIRAFALKAEKLLQGEAGRRAAQGDSSILGQPDANAGHWSEDEAET